MEDKRSLWKRFSERVQTLRPIEPGSKKARSLSMEAQRDNAFNWLDKKSETLRTREMVKLEKNLPDYLLRDTEFAVRFATKHEENPRRIDTVLPLEARTSSEYLAKTMPENESFRRLLDYDATSLGLEPTEKSQPVSEKDKLFAIEHAKSLNSDDALKFLLDSQGSYFGDDNIFFYPDEEQLRSDLLLLNDKILQNKDFLLALDRAGLHLDLLPSYVGRNDSLMRDCLTESPFFFEIASKKVRSEQSSFDQALSSVRNYGKGEMLPKSPGYAAIYEVSSKELQGERENFTKAIKHTDRALQVFKATKAEFKNDKELVEMSLKRDANVLKHASREPRKDRTFVLDMTDKYRVDVLHTKLPTDPEILFNLAKRDSISLKQLLPEMRNDPELVKKVLRHCPSQLRDAENHMKADTEVVLEALKVDGKSLRYAAEEIRNDIYMARVAINENGHAIAHVGPKLETNVALVMESIEQTKSSVYCLPEVMKNDEALFLEIAKNQPELVQYMGDDLKTRLERQLTDSERELYQSHIHEVYREDYIDEDARGLLLADKLKKLDQDEQLDYQLYLEANQNPLPDILASSKLNSVEDITTWLKHHGVRDFTIQPDLTVDVTGSVQLSRIKTGAEVETDIYYGEQMSHGIVDALMTKLPIKFGKVEGDFDISNNGYSDDYVNVVGLSTLEGCPREVGGSFKCSDNRGLTSLEHGPLVVKGDYDISNTSVYRLDPNVEIGGKLIAEGVQLQQANTPTEVPTAKIKTIDPVEEQLLKLFAKPVPSSTSEESSLKMKITKRRIS